MVSDTTSCTSGQCIDARPSRNRGINLPSDSGAEDVLFDYLDAEEGRIYNDLARRIRSVSEELESEKTKQCDRRIAKPLTNLMQE